jgi:hypothetical protein
MKYKINKRRTRKIKGGGGAASTMNYNDTIINQLKRKNENKRNVNSKNGIFNFYTFYQITSRNGNGATETCVIYIDGNDNIIIRDFHSNVYDINFLKEKSKIINMKTKGEFTIEKDIDENKLKKFIQDQSIVVERIFSSKTRNKSGKRSSSKS